MSFRDEQAAEIEAYLAALVKKLGGHSAAVDHVKGCEFPRFQYRAVLFGRNCGVEFELAGNHGPREEAEYAVREMARLAMERVFRNMATAIERAEH
jgi:hypothetical protein